MFLKGLHLHISQLDSLKLIKVKVPLQLSGLSISTLEIKERKKDRENKTFDLEIWNVFSLAWVRPDQSAGSKWISCRHTQTLHKSTQIRHAANTSESAPLICFNSIQAAHINWVQYSSNTALVICRLSRWWGLEQD